MIDLLRRRRRLSRYDNISTQKRLDQIRKENERSRHIENLKAFASELNTADTAEKVNALIAQLSPLYRNTIMRNWPLQNDEDPIKWGARIASGLSAWDQPVRHEGADELLEALGDQDLFDRSLGRIDRLDTMIDRTIKRLVQIKTMKQLFGQLKPKLINGVTHDSAAEKPSKDQPD